MAGVVALLFLLSLVVLRNGHLARSLCAAAFILLLFNPSVAEEQRQPANDVAVIVADRSPSQSFGKRATRTQEALDALKKKLSDVPGLDLRIVGERGEGNSLTTETRLFDKLDDVLADVPASRRAGVIFLSDGQIHDIPKDGGDAYGPVHLLLSGEKNERDRRLVILESPSYGIIGETVTIRYRVEDSGTSGESHASIVLRQGNVDSRMDLVPVNEESSFNVTIDHAGQNIFDLEAAPLKDEITAANNRVPIIVNGVRDRLRVLLVSGQPHAGGRTWRNLLTSDPGIDLVHFTILREPDKLDATPKNDLSLIAFPFEELFETKLYDFDLIIFDHYGVNRILPSFYYGNIARYVKEGGALLEDSGPSYADTDTSLYSTELGNVLPALPTGDVIEKPFMPALTDMGKRHPVTRGLHWQGDTTGKNWGRWLRQIGVSTAQGDVLMNGADRIPLLILDRVEKGRVAQLTSDQIWLWSRGFEGGGPHAELLRRLAHWLMKEPELEENALEVSVLENTLLIRRRSLEDSPISVTVTAPDGKKTEMELKPGDDGTPEARLPVDQLGVFTVSDGVREQFVLAGKVNPPELTDVLTSPEKLGPLVNSSHGAALWLEKTPHPDVKVLPPGRNYGGQGWIGLRRNGSYTTISIKRSPLLPAWTSAAFLMILALYTWWREGQTRGGP